MIVGVIADTHGLIRPEAFDALRGCALILHAGDVGSAAILAELGKIAPVYAVKGNVDVLDLPFDLVIPAGAARMYMVHRPQDAKPPAGCAAVICGHTHRALHEVRNGVLHLNPGSAGPRRFRLPVTLAKIYSNGADMRSEIIHLL